MREALALGYNVTFRLVDPATGRVVAECRTHNLVTTVGKRALLSASAGKTLKDFSVISVGTGTVAPDPADTGLTIELIRGSGSQSNPTPDSLKTEVTFSAGAAAGTITEGGLSLADGGSDATGTVSVVINSSHFTVGGIGSAGGTYDGGTVEFTSGTNVGLTGSISTQTLVSGAAQLVLGSGMPNVPAIGDNVTLRPAGGVPAMLCHALPGSSLVWDSTHNLIVTWTLSLS